MYAYKHTAKAATYTVKVPAYSKSTAVTVKANGFAAVNFDVVAAGHCRWIMAAGDRRRGDRWSYLPAHD